MSFTQCPALTFACSCGEIEDCKLKEAVTMVSGVATARLESLKRSEGIIAQEGQKMTRTDGAH